MRRIGSAIAAVIGPEELAIYTALAVLTAGLWPLAGQASLIAPGLVMAWMYLPGRAGFIERGPAPKPPRRAE